MKKKYFLTTLLLIFLVVATSNSESNKNTSKIIKDIIGQTLTCVNKQFEKKSSLQTVKLYRAVYSSKNESIDNLRELLKEGLNPDTCTGIHGWIDSNPLNIIAVQEYNRSELKHYSLQKILTPSLPVQKLQILVKAGANINKYPYVWYRVYRLDNSIINGMKTLETSENEKELNEYIDSYVQSANTVLKAFLKAGADPDKRGALPPSYVINAFDMTDKDLEVYFKKGTRPVNEAIKKGIIWESQVDLLLQYTKLDKNSLKAAQMSGDQKMIAKINKLWEKQSTEF